MIVSKYSTVFDEVTYDINELADLYWSELSHMSKQYGEKMKWPTTKRQAYTPGVEAIAHADFGYETICEWEPIKRIYDQFNLPDCVKSTPDKTTGNAIEGAVRPYSPNDVDLLVYKKDYLFPPHVDYHQNCVMMLPIWPLDGGTPVKYHNFENQIEWIQREIAENRKDREVYKDTPDWQPGDILPKHLKFRHIGAYEDVDEYVHYSTKHPTLINGRFIHSIGPVKEDIRVYLRFKFLPPITYDGILELNRQGKWIKE
jgi:hypothetical protein